MYNSQKSNSDRINQIKEYIQNKQYNEFKANISDLNYADIASLIEENLEDDESISAIRLFRMLPKNIAAEVFAYFDVDVQQYFITKLSDEEITAIINDMYGMI